MYNYILIFLILCYFFRHWSKKYPICITLAKDQLNFDNEIWSKFEDEILKDTETDNTRSSDKSKLIGGTSREKKGFNRFKKKEYPMLVSFFLLFCSYY